MKLTLVKKVLILVIILFFSTSAILSFVVADQIKQTYLNLQKRNVAENVLKQARQNLKAADFSKNDFTAYQKEIISSEIVRVKIYDIKGIVLYSDEKELVGQNLFA